MHTWSMDLTGLKILTNFEGTILTVYKDVAGIETVCTGHVKRPGDDAWIQDGVTREECLGVLSRDLSGFFGTINRVIRPDVDLSQPMVNACGCLAFNIGSGGFETSSVVKYINQGNLEAAADAFLLWAYAKVKQKDGTYVKSPVLLGRRKAEAALFRSGIGEVSGPSLAELSKMAYDLSFALTPVSGAHASDDLFPSFVDNAELLDGKLVAMPPEYEEALAA